MRQIYNPAAQYSRKTFEPFDPEAATFSPSRLGMTQEEIIQRINHYRQTGERTLPADRRAEKRETVR